MCSACAWLQSEDFTMSLHGPEQLVEAILPQSQILKFTLSHNCVHPTAPPKKYLMNKDLDARADPSWPRWPSGINGL